MRYHVENNYDQLPVSILTGTELLLGGEQFLLLMYHWDPDLEKFEGRSRIRKRQYRYGPEYWLQVFL